MQARHEEELRTLHARIAQADGELTARRAAETRAKLELRARRDGEAKAKAGLAESRDAQERQARAREFQEAVGLSPRGVERARAATAARAAAPPLDAPPELAPARAAPPPHEGTPGKYDQLTPRAGSRAAQRDAIAALEQQAQAALDAEGEWTPRGQAATSPEATTTPAAIPARLPALGGAAATASPAAALVAPLEEVSEAGADPEALQAELAQLQAEARGAARESAARSAEAREALAAGQLDEATELAKQAEAASARARQRRREAEVLYIRLQKGRAAAGPRAVSDYLQSPIQPLTPAAPKSLHRTAPLPPTDAQLCSDSLPDAGGAAGRPSVPVLPLSGIPGAAPPPPTRLAEAETGAKKGGLKFGFQKPKRRSGSPRRSAAEDAAVPEQRV